MANSPTTVLPAPVGAHTRTPEPSSRASQASTWNGSREEPSSAGKSDSVGGGVRRRGGGGVPPRGGREPGGGAGQAPKEKPSPPPTIEGPRPPHPSLPRDEPP